MQSQFEIMMGQPSPQTFDRPLVFATSNADKLREAREILGINLEGVEIELEERQTTDLPDLVRGKAIAAWSKLGRPVMVEDTSLGFAAWGGLPGPFIKYFLEKMTPDGLEHALAPGQTREAEALCAVAYHDGWRVRIFQGRVAGTITPPRGERGFGWDAIFQPEGLDRTFAEMEPAEKHAHSMRARALAGLAAHLQSRRD